MATTAPLESSAVSLRNVPEDTLIKLFLRGLAYDRPDAMLFKEGEEWQPLSHRQVGERVARLAAGLEGLGVGRGDRVAILSENRPEWAIADFAVLLMGAVDVPLYSTLPANQLAYILADAGACAILASTPEQLRKIAEIRSQLPALKAVISFDPHPTDTDVLRILEVERQGEERIARGEFPSLAEFSAKVAADDLATLIYTSGTTGEPKGVMLSHFNIASNVAAVEQHRVFELAPGVICLSFLPLSHSFERMVDYYYWYSGCTIAYVDSVDKVAQSMLEVRPHVVAAAPRVFEKIYGRVMGATGIKRRLVMWAKGVGEASVEERLSGARPGPTGLAEKLADRLVFSKLRERTGGRIRAFVSGSAPLSADIARFFWAAGLPVYEGYGLTETSPVLTVNRPGGVRLGSVGQAIPGTELRIGADGEILARGPQIMKGYFEKPDATAEMIDSDGWIHTGDVGELDSEGFLRITDRIKNMIVTAGGKNIAPAPIENAAAMSPYVSQAVMIGDKRPFPMLLVIPDYDNLKDWAASQGIGAPDQASLAHDPRVHALLERETLGRLTGFARYELPKKIAVIPTELSIDAGEVTPTMKVRRSVVEEKYGELIEQIYGES